MDITFIPVMEYVKIQESQDLHYAPIVLAN